MTEEQFLIQQIEEIKSVYMKAVQPYIDRLIIIRSMKVTAYELNLETNELCIIADKDK